ncbi:type II toxin-antitoxin system RelE/ParE family toxin [Sphingomonas sp.]|uniref:type II toxin-antitoxin system RelE/ParE family toxin n=1 Tax=Sphingomonas sp. TaxID=28214 RepID=UPI0017BD2475|nr:type II toxin-antitoxin system RelE/ParE family toxin [Sphingomonas sp.]MBA4763118.1 type II toxin-antitoxin system RelE/ParE family toxin [Sphingomonas sp.]
MSYRIKLRPRAHADLREIGDYSDSRWGREQAQRYLEAIADSFDQISEMPLAGSDQAEVSPGLRKWRSGSHNIFYRVREDVVLIVRVLHARMDVVGIRATLQSPVAEYRPAG